MHGSEREALESGRLFQGFDREGIETQQPNVLHVSRRSPALGEAERGNDTLSDSARGFAPVRICGADPDLGPRHVDHEVDAVGQRAGDAALLAGDGLGGAAAGENRVAPVSTRARIHGGDELEPRRELERRPRPRNDQPALFERLAQSLEGAS